MRVAPLVAQGLSASYGNRVVVDDVSLTLEAGTLTALVGANGAGKSTLLHLLQGRLTPSAGNVACDGMPIQSCRERVVLMPQRGRIDWAFPITVREFVALGEIGQRSFGCCDREAALQRVGLETLANRRLDALSGGQQQRALLARTLVQPSRVLLLDEPCAGLDPAARENFLQFIENLGREKSVPNFVFVTHHVEEITSIYTHALLLRDGRVLDSGPIKKMLTSEKISAVFRERVRIKKIDGRYRLKL